MIPCCGCPGPSPRSPTPPLHATASSQATYIGQRQNPTKSTNWVQISEVTHLERYKWESGFEFTYPKGFVTRLKSGHSLIINKIATIYWSHAMQRILFNDNWRQTEAWIFLLAGEVEVNALAQGALRRLTQWSWIEHPNSTTELITAQNLCHWKAPL